ncbi:MAG: bifunctional phosphopantothenoylcysteine decarboxylase/phosphopantothenate--cysteine ligase CoaBC [Candidatus Binatus sp.]|uniref:bifunctional phosphopantothenoylcysteine decarboxylase/phosphopantothenate--cysteine ligase CoaBC n=1 Tax=Candidatus Binatus sp. TaxID=2811406 RepID=UPI003C71566A
MGVLDGKTIVLGVSGGIAAYKSAELVRLLVTSGANVRVMMTRNATEFITPLTLQTLSSNPVATDTFSLTQESEIGHIRLADSADAIVIAPATADVIAKVAVGIADDIVTTVLLATRAKVAFAPAMNVHMYDHPTVAENLAKLRTRGAVIIEPGEGALACGYEGKGRLPDPATVVAEIEKMLSAQDLAGENILVTAGPTREPIDPVRFVSNSSSGKMGFAIARAAWRRGANVRIVAGPSALATPYGVERIDTVAASAMLAKTTSNFPWSTVLVMAAAVADFRPANPAAGKIKKDARGLRLEMESIADEMPRIAAKKGARILVGFAAETDDLEANARAKLKRKGLDLIVANDVTREGAGFEVDTNIVTLIGADGSSRSHPQMSKDAVADLILDRIVALRGAKPKSGRPEKPSRLRAVR